MQEFGSAFDSNGFLFDIDPCVCHLSRYCLLFILTASPAEKTRLSKVKNILSMNLKMEQCIMCVDYFKMYVHKSDLFFFSRTFKYFRIDTYVHEFCFGDI